MTRLLQLNTEVSWKQSCYMSKSTSASAEEGGKGSSNESLDYASKPDMEVIDQPIITILDTSTFDPLMADKNRKVGMLFTVCLATESKQTHTHTHTHTDRHPLKHVTMYSMFISYHPRSQDRAATEVNQLLGTGPQRCSTFPQT